MVECNPGAEEVLGARGRACSGGLGGNGAVRQSKEDLVVEKFAKVIVVVTMVARLHKLDDWVVRRVIGL